LNLHPGTETGSSEVLARHSHRLRARIAAEDGERCIPARVRSRFAQAPPQRRVECGELLESERASGTRRDVECNGGRLDEQRAATAPGIEEGFGAVPAREQHDARGEVLAQRCFDRTLAPAALEERLARSIE